MQLGGTLKPQGVVVAGRIAKRTVCNSIIAATNGEEHNGKQQGGEQEVSHESRLLETKILVVLVPA
jgi:hypothetical protein